jgi:hypothetical protein
MRECHVPSPGVLAKDNINRVGNLSDFPLDSPVENMNMLYNYENSQVTQPRWDARGVSQGHRTMKKSKNQHEDEERNDGGNDTNAEIRERRKSYDRGNLSGPTGPVISVSKRSGAQEFI